MDSFKKFMKRSEEHEDLTDMLDKIPKSHRKLLHGYDFKFQGGNTLDGDDAHIGYMDSEKEEIAVAAPWNYGREFAMLHEVAHVVWENIVNNDLKNKWSKIIKRTKNQQIKKANTESDSLDQSAEELFCMCYSNYYTKHKITTYSHPEWMRFIQGLPQ